MAKLGVLVLHGMGSQKPDYANDMIAELVLRIGKLELSADGPKLDPSDVKWEAVYLAEIMEAREGLLWERLASGGALRYDGLRQFIIHNFGDAIAYQRVQAQKIDAYRQVHAKIFEHVQALRAQLGDGAGGERPLVVMAHSLGCYMVSDYIWDRHSNKKNDRPDDFGGNPFYEMETLAGIVTFGCNIALFSLAYDPFTAIKFPHANLPQSFPPGTAPEKLRAAVRWLNFYDADDVLGYPLKTLSPSYDAAVTSDIAINAGSVLQSWNPFSHEGYWTDNDMTKPAAELIAGLLRLL